MNRILVVIPTKDRECLAWNLMALKAQKAQNFDVLVIGSSKVEIPKDYRYIKTDKNFVESLNLGLETALKESYEWVVFFDDDSIPVNYYFDYFDHASKGETCVGGSCSFLAKHSGIPKIHFDGSVSGSLESFYGMNPAYVGHLQGCNWAVKLSEVGDIRFDEHLSRVGFRSETDFQVRLKKKGVKLLWHPALTVNHLNWKGGSFDTIKNNYWRGYDHCHYVLKNFGFWPAIIGILLTNRTSPRPLWQGIPAALLGKYDLDWYRGFWARLIK